MKQLRIDYNYYDDQDNLIHTDTFISTFFGELPPGSLISALKLLSAGVGDGWYSIVDIKIL